jgi:hypothetical protein
MTPDGLITLFVRPLNRLGLRYMVTGGVASVIYGEPRLTRDVDVVISLDGRDATRLASAWPPELFYIPPGEVLREEAGRDGHGHFNVVHHESMGRADFYVAGSDPLAAWGLERAVDAVVGGDTIRLAPVEYVILSKLRYYRDGRSGRHLRDVRHIMSVSGGLVDRHALDEWLDREHLWNEWRLVPGATQEGSPE